MDRMSDLPQSNEALLAEEIEILYQESANGLIVFRKNDEGQYICHSCNPAICTILEASREQLLGKSFMEVFTGENYSQLHQVYSSVIEAKTNYPVYVNKGEDHYQVLLRHGKNELNTYSLIVSFVDRWKSSPIFIGNNVLLDSLQDSVFIFDVTADGQFRLNYLNKSHMETTGSNLTRDIGRTPVEIMGEQSGTMLQSYYEECLRTMAPVRYENYLYFPPLDQHKWMQTQLSPVIVDGKVTQIIGASRDITDRILATERIEKLYLEYEALFNETAVPIWVEDVEDDQDVHSVRLRRYNPCFEAVYGLTTQQNAGKTIMEIVQDPTDVKRISERYAQVLSQREPITFEIELVIQGLHIVNLTTLTPIIRDGQVTNIIGSSIDITELRRYQEMLKLEGEVLTDLVHQQSQVLRTSFTQQDNLLASITEAFQEPLVSTLGLVEIVLTTSSPSDSRYLYLQQIQQQTEDLLRLVKGVLQENEIAAGELLRIKSFDIKAMIRKVITECVIELPGFDNRITFDDHLPMQTIWQDEQRVIRIVYALIKDGMGRMIDEEKLVVEGIYLAEQKRIQFAGLIDLSPTRFDTANEALLLQQYDRLIQEDFRFGIDIKLVQLLVNKIGGTMDYRRDGRTVKMILTIPLMQQSE